MQGYKTPLIVILFTKLPSVMTVTYTGEDPDGWLAYTAVGLGSSYTQFAGRLLMHLSAGLRKHLRNGDHTRVCQSNRLFKFDPKSGSDNS